MSVLSDTQPQPQLTFLDTTMPYVVETACSTSAFPVQCTCNQIIGDLWSEWFRLLHRERLSEGEALRRLAELRQLNLCCRERFICTVPGSFELPQ